MDEPGGYWDESNRSPMPRGTKRDYQGRLVKWSKKRQRYVLLVPSTPEAVDYILDAPAPAFYAYADERPQFWDKTSTGYGGSLEWPFDFHRAVMDDGYRRGVYNAMQAMWTSDNWKFHTQKQLDRVWRVRKRAAQYVNKYRTVNFIQALEEQCQYNSL